jgi:hypothetical protein
MRESTVTLKNVDVRTNTTAINNTKKLVRYGMQLAMLNKLLSCKMMTEKEYHKVSEQLKSDYRIASL